MKYILCLFLLFILTSCNKTLDVSYKVELINYKAFALEISSNNIECIDIEYEIKDEYDTFYLYTIYQNYLPEGYTTVAHMNIKLINCYEKNDGVYYEVDNFIYFVEDILLFKEVLSKTNELYGMKEAYFVFNNKIIS